MKFPRAGGILLHPTSLPGNFGIGDLGPIAYDFVNFLAEAGQTYWQILPLNPTGYGDSPYSAFSAFAGNTLLVSPEKLIEAGLLTKPQLRPMPKFKTARVDYGKVYGWKQRVLADAYQTFTAGEQNETRSEYDRFCEMNWPWLDDYALYRALKISNGQKPWYEWDEKIKLRDTSAVTNARAEFSNEISAQKFYQFVFFRQWDELRTYANSHGIKIVGDVPIFVALDSADVWCNQDKFKLDPDGSPEVVAGVPPDYFSKTGQLWGNPIYDWERMRDDNFGWWVSRIRYALKTVDVIRIDHFRGFVSAWEVPGGEKTAENGRWVQGLGRELFETFSRELGDVPFWAEDLGVMTSDVEELRDSFELPGMRILQYAFAGDAKNRDLPHNYINHCVAYTGTHDNDTSRGWFESRSSADGKPNREREYCLEYLNSTGDEIHWDMIRAVWSSVADTAIVPLQDILGLGNDSRMNMPASGNGNWQWRFASIEEINEFAPRLLNLSETYGRSR